MRKKKAERDNRHISKISDLLRHLKNSILKNPRHLRKPTDLRDDRRIFDFNKKITPIRVGAMHQKNDQEIDHTIGTPIQLFTEIEPRQKNLTCIRRSERRKVIFSTGKGGAKGKQKKHIFTEQSKVRC